LNETLLALRRITLNANTQGGNPFWTPANTAIGIAQMRAFLARSFPAYPDMSGLPFPQETILGIQPDYKIPYSANVAVGMTHDFGPKLSVRADYVRTRTYDANIGGDTNWIQNADGTFTRKDTRYANTTLVGNGGSIWYNGLESRLEYRPTPSSRAGLSYTLSKTRSNTSTGLSTGGTTNIFNLDEDLGPDDNDRRHNIVFDASISCRGSTCNWPPLRPIAARCRTASAPAFSSMPIRSRIVRARGSRRGSSDKSTDVRLSKIFRFGGRRSATAFWKCSTCSTSTTGSAIRAACSRRSSGWR